MKAYSLTQDTNTKIMHGLTSVPVSRPVANRAATKAKSDEIKAKKSNFKEDNWHASLAEVVNFKKVHGHCNVPREWKHDPKVGNWVHTQRRQFFARKQDRRNDMTDERIRKLEDIGFELTLGRGKCTIKRKRKMKANSEDNWDASLAKVVNFKKEHGHCNVPCKWKRDPKMGNWVYTQRKQFFFRKQDRRNNMTDERIRKLEDIGFEWSRKKEMQGNSDSDSESDDSSSDDDIDSDSDGESESDSDSERE